MQQLTTFVINHWGLFAVLLVISSLLAITGMGNRVRGIKMLTPGEATQLINHQDAVVLDVREDKEFAEGHILNAMHIPLGMLEKQIQKLDKYKSRPVIVSCRTSNRSNSACALLRKNGFESVFNLAGGITAWRNANFPLTKS